MDFTSINKTITKESQQTKTKTCFCGGSEKTRFKIFLNFPFEEEFTVPFISLGFY